MSRTDEYERLSNLELSRHPHVKYERMKGPKHNVLVLHAKGQSRKVFYPATPGCGNGPRNHVQDVRRMLRLMNVIV